MTVPDVEQDEPDKDGNTAAPIIPAPTITAGAVVPPAAVASAGEADAPTEDPVEEGRRAGEQDPGGTDGPVGGFRAPSS
ncbi:hypothetical protein [Motilibacter deserti]|uniref:Uncharacterized protein n=1 Tax=Motilibacter deserti TaxID=2714956 RepID=A0ABX0GXM1_9ACTN|nr:hypothetical protein [Motilibacter deserti]NHC14445.1 hypothetical protein [Motilibacter deserti]